MRPRSNRLAFACACAALAAFAPTQQPTYSAVDTTADDPVLATLPGGFALAIPGLFDDFELAGGGQFVARPNGTAHLSGRVQSHGSVFSAFVVELEFAGRLAPGQLGYPPAGSPLQLLQPSAYAPTGPVDPSTFVYYTAVSGTLTGSHDYDGAVIDVQLGTQAAQLGAGANNRNGALGLAAALSLTVAQQPATPFPPLATAELACDLPPQITDHATHPELDPTRATMAFGRALALGGVADDYEFVPAGEFTEFADGHAVLSGRLVSISALDDAWDATLSLTGRVDPGEPSHPPANSPVLQMQANAYVGSGGTVDPAQWRYYTAGTGTLTGVGQNDGGSIDLAAAGAFQIGSGANQADLFFGGYGALTVTLTAQPTPRTIAPTGTAEMFWIGSRAPVLPWPTLTVPAANHALPTLTDQGLALDGTNLAWTEFVAFDTILIAPGDATDWFRGWFRVVDDRHLEVHPPPGLAAGTYALSAVNASLLSNTLQIDLTAPPSPALYAEAALDVQSVAHLLVHPGATPVPLTVLCASLSHQPTVFPGVVSLAIGNGGPRLIVLAFGLPHDPVTRIARRDFPPITAAGLGLSIHFQALVGDLATMALPVPVTNAWTVHY